MKEINSQVLKSSTKEFVVNIINSVLLRASVLIIPVIWSYAIDYINDCNYKGAITLIIVSIFVTVIYYGFEQWYQVTLYKLYNKLYNNYENIYAEAFYRNSLFSLSRFSLSEYSNILNSDVDVMASYYCNLPMRLIRIFEFLVIYIYFYFIDPIIFVITLVVSIVSLAYMIFSTKETERLNKLRKESLDVKTASNQEIYLNIRDIKSFDLYDKITDVANPKRQEYLKQNARFNIQSIGAKHISLIIVEVFRLVVMIYGVYLIKAGNMEIGSLLIVYSYYQKIVDNYTIVSNVLISNKSLKVSLLRFGKILVNANKEKTANDSIEIKGRIVFKDVLYGYRDNPTLKDTSFVIEPNTLNIVTGPTGNGKTGIIDLLLKMNRPHSGSITIDENNIFDIKSNNFYNMIACVSKTPTFFNDSIKNNLLIINNDFDRIVEVCKMLNIHDYIMKLPKKYDTNINGDIKTNVKYLIAIARVIIKNPKIMLFDETSAMLEGSDDDNFRTVLENLKKDHTIIVISRERNLDDIADSIIVIDEHTCCEQGSMEELLKNKGAYAKLVGHK